MLDLAELRQGWTGARDFAAAERLEAEIAKLAALDGEEPSWKVVRDEAMAVLRSAPDLQAAAYLTQALLRLDGIDGLSRGLALLRDLLRDQWEPLHPTPDRPRARRSALLWVAERCARSLPPAIAPDALARCVVIVGELYAECERRFGEPLLGALRRRLDAALASVSPAPISSPSVPLRMSTAGTRAEAIARIAQAADYFLRSEPHSPIGPLLRRALAWGEVGFEEVFRELLARAPEARNALWETLGLKPEPKR